VWFKDGIDHEYGWRKGKHALKANKEKQKKKKMCPRRLQNSMKWKVSNVGRQ
jgi:hypothetical protein